MSLPYSDIEQLAASQVTVILFLLFGTGASRIGKNSIVSSYNWEIFIAALYPIISTGKTETCFLRRMNWKKDETVRMVCAIEKLKYFGPFSLSILIPVCGTYITGICC